MKTFTIRAKGSNTTSVHDIVHSDIDRDIKFRKGCQFAIVLSSYYSMHNGNPGYSTYKSAARAAVASRKTNISHKIIDVDGVEYMTTRRHDGFDLVPIVNS